MDNNANGKKINKAKSRVAPTKLKNEPSKRKSFNVNDAVKSLDLALDRLKRSKLNNGEYGTKAPFPAKQGPIANMHVDSKFSVNSNFRQSADTASLMSMNFSHYELMRNVSRSNCNSDGAFSGSTHTGNAHWNPADITMKDEHLERYFRSLDMWGRNSRGGCSSSDHRELFEK